MQKHSIIRLATLALTHGLEARHLQRHRSLAAIPVEGVVMLNLGSLILLLIGQSV
jgi:hypothetical protein